jgi:hypothetical protein
MKNADEGVRGGCRQIQVKGNWPRQTHGGIMRIRRTVIAPIIITFGAVGSLVAVPAVTAISAVTPTAVVVATGPDAIIVHAWNKRPASRPPSIDPIDCGLLAFVGVTWCPGDRFREYFARAMLQRPLPAGCAGVSVTRGASASRGTHIAKLTNNSQWKST